MIDEYITLGDKVAWGLVRFFLAISVKATSEETFFVNQPLGESSFLLNVKSCCADEGTKGSGTKGLVTNHGLRGTLASLLLEQRHFDSIVSLRTGHGNPRSLQSY